MTNYTKTTDFAAKDALPSGNSAKIVKGSEIDTEFNNIATASATKANANAAALTGTTTFETISDGTIAITAFVDEDNMASDSATLLPTQQSVKAYVDSQVTAQDLDVTDGSTSIDIDLDSESLGILGGTGIDSTASGTGVTLAIDSTVATLTGSQTLSNKTLSAPVVSGNLTTDGLLDGRDVATDGTKLDGIEASADVTDTANVTAAGALMDSELTSEASVKALNQGVATTDSPTFAGLTTTADVSFGDNDKAIFGAGSDLQIYHDASHSFIKDSGTGHLKIQATNLKLQDVDGNNYIDCIDGSYVRLMHNTATKLETTSTGIDVTGTVTADGLTVDGDGSFTGNFEISGLSPKIFLSETDTTDVNTRIRNAAGKLQIQTVDNSDANPVNRFQIDHATGDISFYEDTGTTPKFFWDASAESLGIGTTNPASLLQLSGSPVATSGALATFRNSDATSSNTTFGGILFNSSPGTDFSIGKANVNAATSLSFRNGNTGASLMDLTSAGNVGIGTDSPAKSLDVAGAIRAINSAGSSAAEIDITSGGTWRFRSNPTTGTNSYGLDIVKGSAGTDVKMSIDSSGNVEVKGGQELRVYRGDNATYGSMKYLTGSGGLQLNDKNGDGISFVKADGATEYGRFDASGNLGIGTSSPNRNLHVSGGAADVAFGITNSASGTSASDGFSITLENPTPDVAIRQRENANMKFLTNNTERMRIDSSGNVGVGVTPESWNTYKTLQIGNGAIANYTPTHDMRMVSNAYYNSGWKYAESDGACLYLQDGDNSAHIWSVAASGTADAALTWSEAMRIDSSRNLLVGKTYTATGNVGQELRAGGYTAFTRSGGNPLELNRLASDGTIANFSKDGSTVGSIGTVTQGGATNLVLDSASAVYFDTNIRPKTDNTYDVGSSSYRFDDIYATNGTIQTSDRNEKQDIEALSDAEQRVAVAAKGLLRKFRWINSVEENGDDARIHFGIIAQDLQAAFESEGLDASDYAMFISTTWTDEETNEEKTRMGVRYSELLAFIISAI